MNFLTDFADQAVILPMMVAATLMLAVSGWWRGALAFLVAIGGTFTAVLVMKMGAQACTPVFGPWGVHSPSGHTAAAAVMAGGLTALFTRRIWAIGAMALAGAVIIGLSRLALGVHSRPEVLLGGIAGLAGAMLLTRLAGPGVRERRLSPVIASVAVAVISHGWHLPAEAAIGRASHGALDFVAACRDPVVKASRPSPASAEDGGQAMSPIIRDGDAIAPAGTRGIRSGFKPEGDGGPTAAPPPRPSSSRAKASSAMPLQRTGVQSSGLSSV